MNRLCREEGIISWIQYAFLAYNSYSRLVRTFSNACQPYADISGINVVILLSNGLLLHNLTNSWTLHMVC